MKQNKLYVFKDGLVVKTNNDKIVYCNKLITYFKLLKGFHNKIRGQPVYNGLRLVKDGNLQPHQDQSTKHTNNNYRHLKTCSKNIVGEQLQQSHLLDKLKSLFGSYSVTDY